MLRFILPLPKIVPDTRHYEASQRRDCRYNFVYEVNVWGCAFNQVDRVVTRIASAAEQVEEVRFDDPGGRMRVTLMDGTADYEEGAFVQSLRFEIKYNGNSI